ELAKTVEDVETVKEVVDTEEFAKLRDNLPELTKSFSKVATKTPDKNPGGKRKDFQFL
ncbi:TPA: phage capsid protein, partial [Klebsiella pneumoniae]|nr:phage capsid protein [Klebsiella pneumoniae]